MSKSSTTSHGGCVFYNVVLPVDPPSFTSPQQEILDLAVDGKPILNCSSDGNPQPYYRLLSPASDLKSPETRGVFRPLSPLLPGTYNCTATNHLGSATKVFIVHRSSKFSLLLFLMDLIDNPNPTPSPTLTHQLPSFFSR